MKNKKKVTLLGVAFIAAVITLAGVGYAFSGHTGYKGSVATTEANPYDVDYVVVKFTSPTAYVADSTFYLTWNTETVYDVQEEEETVTYTWQASDTLVHSLDIEATDASGNTPDTYKLFADVTFTGEGYKLYYIMDDVSGYVDDDDMSDWTEYNAECALKVGGETVEPGPIGQAAPVLITWVAIPDDTELDGTAPVTAVTIGIITYTVEASQYVAPQSP